ncbi:MAG: sensor histidine kinase [Elusimicrobia bacterium]|nr:sensor histidine kinase [Elusimicrobiota bacterium]
MTLSDDLFRRIDLALRQAKAGARPPAPAEVEAKAPDAAKSDAAKRLAESETELRESRDAVARLLLQLARERRRWQAAILSVRRRIKSVRPAARKAAKRLGDLEVELAESQETAAKLLMEITRTGRRAGAERRIGLRAQRRRAGAAKNSGGSLVPAIAAAASRFEEGLRAVIESPAMNPEAVSLVARQGMALTRTLRLAAEISDGLPAASEPGALIRERMDRCLDQWEPEAARRRITIVRRHADDLPAALVPLGGFESILDELYGGAIDRAPRGTVVVAEAEAAPDGGLSISVQDPGGNAPKRARGALEGLAFALARELVERWGGRLETRAAAGGRGRRAALRLAAAKPGS